MTSPLTSKLPRSIEQITQLSEVLPPDSGGKRVMVGTHRVCTPEETLARVQPYLSLMGITRIADLTHLDNLGIPVCQAIRPNSRNLSVSQGKGITKSLAKVSAVMEAIELWHAEEPQLPCVREEVGAMVKSLPYALNDLDIAPHAILHETLPLDWSPAFFIGTTEQTVLPTEYLRLNGSTGNTWLLPTFQHTSNGLASGNIRVEAILHGLYEVIERDTLARSREHMIPIMMIDPATVDSPAEGMLLERLRSAGASVEIRAMLGPSQIVCFETRLTSPNYPMLISGYGCHLDRDVALSRALTESAQIRLSVISGARDDIHHAAYKEIQQMRSLKHARDSQTLTDFRALPSMCSPDLEADLREVTRRVSEVVNCPPLYVDLTRSDVNIPVVHVVVPQMRVMEGH